MSNPLWQDGGMNEEFTNDDWRDRQSRGGHRVSAMRMIWYSGLGDEPSPPRFVGKPLWAAKQGLVGKSGPLGFVRPKNGIDAKGGRLRQVTLRYA
jgi:hypothetical protein